MSEKQPSMEEIIAKQKEQCPFCKIIAGEIPSTKVYEDELILAIMDINPASKGHILVMPKEHYPIMPLVPRKTFSHMLTISSYIIRAIKKALHSDMVSIFIANGGIAGQQSTHVMIHIIPRNKGDALSFLDCNGKNTETTKDIKSFLETHIGATLLEHSKENEDLAKHLLVKVADSSLDINTEKEQSKVQVSSAQKDKITELYNSNPEFKALLLNEPEKVEQLVAQDETFAALFGGINIYALSQKLQDMEKKKHGRE